ncbi:MarR family winged helix-turn-helix transcriptional regulator [Chloroflexota bacterium]
MEKLSSMERDYILWFLLAQTKDAILKARKKELARDNIAARQAAVLFIIEAISDSGNEITPAEIARWLFREPHSVSEMLVRMEKEGLIKKVKDLERKNQVRVVLTENGRKAYNQSRKRESISRIFSTLSEEDRQQLIKCLQMLRNNAVQELREESKFAFSPIV